MSKIKTFLTIVPGRHHLGYAVFHCNKLTFYGVASFSLFKKKDELCRGVEKFVRKIFKRFEIEKVVFRKLSKAQKESSLLVEINQYLKSFCRNRKVKISHFDNDFINRHFCRPNQRPTKEKTASALIVKYPELKRYRELKKQWQKRYYMRVFQAIALGLVCLADLRSKPEKIGDEAKEMNESNN